MFLKVIKDKAWRVWLEGKIDGQRPVMYATAKDALIVIIAISWIHCVHISIVAL
jgi:hypothetical protein